jgi:hypothetical protein
MVSNTLERLGRLGIRPDSIRDGFAIDFDGVIARDALPFAEGTTRRLLQQLGLDIRGRDIVGRPSRSQQFVEFADRSLSRMTGLQNSPGVRCISQDDAFPDYFEVS